MLNTFKNLHPNIRIRLLTTFLSKVFGTAVLPFMGLLFAREAGSTVAGTLLTIQYLMQFCVGLYGGAASDTLGRKRMMVWGESIKVIAFTLMLFAALSENLLFPIFIGLLILAIGNGLSTPSGEALLIDVSTLQNRSFMYAVNYWGNNLGYLLGAPIGALLLREHLSLLFALLTGIASLILWITVRFIHDAKGKNIQPRQKRIGFGVLVSNYQEVAKDRAFLWFSLSGSLIMFIEFARTTFMGVHFDQVFDGRAFALPILGLVSFDGARALAFISAENTFLIVLGTAATARFLTSREPRRWLMVGFTLFGLGYCATMLAGTPLTLFFAGIVFSIGELLHVPTRQAVLADMIDAERRGAYMAVNGMVFQAGKLLASGGLILWPILGRNNMIAVMLSFTALACFIGWRASARARKLPIQDFQELVIDSRVTQS
jgi:MFS transporter, DHA1 family, multidrug resistance protein B